MVVLFFEFYHYQLTMSCRDFHVVTLQSSVRSVLEAWDRYSKTKLMFLFKKISDYNLDVLILYPFLLEPYSSYVTLHLIM